MLPTPMTARPPSRLLAGDRRHALAGVFLIALTAVAACGRPQPRHAEPLERCTYEGDCQEARARCDAGGVDACLTLGHLYGTATKEAREFHQPALGEAYLLRACKLSVLACYGVVDVAEHQRALCEFDYATETRLIEAACEVGYPRACAVLADKLVDGVDLPRDTGRAARLYAFACDVEDRFPEFTMIGQGGTRVPPPDPMALQVHACVRGGRLSELGLGGASPPRTTPEEAARLFAARAAKYQVPRRLAPEAWVEAERKAAEAFAQGPVERAAAVRVARKPGGVQLGCR